MRILLSIIGLASCLSLMLPTIAHAQWNARTLPMDSVLMEALLWEMPDWNGVSIPYDYLASFPEKEGIYFPTIPEMVVTVEKQIPEVYREDEKLKLRIPIFWREDIIVPIPKGLDKAGPRPPYDAVMAWQRSLMVPCWGQIYNRSYWKIPIFLLGYAGAGGYIYYTNNFYQQLRSAYLASIDIDPNNDDPRFAGYDSDGIRNLREQFRNQRDQAILIALGWHLVQVAEAYVDAHMKGFDVSEDLTFLQKVKVSPSMSYLAAGPAYGFTITF